MLILKLSAALALFALLTSLGSGTAERFDNERRRTRRPRPNRWSAGTRSRRARRRGPRNPKSGSRERP